MNDTLKVAGRIGAELGAAKAENEKLRGLVAEVVNYLSGSKLNRIESGSILHRKLLDALSHQAEPEIDYSYHSHEFAKAHAEPAPAQDERECCCPKIGEPWNPEKHGRDCPAHQAKRPAQTEQQPVATIDSEAWLQEWARGKFTYTGAYKPRVLGQLYGNTDWALARALHSAIVSQLAAPIAQTAPQQSDDALIANAKALLALDERGSLAPHGIGGLAREVIEKLVARVEQTAPQPELVMPVALGSVNADYDKGWADHAAEVVRLNAAPQPEQSGLVEALRGVLSTEHLEHAQAIANGALGRHWAALSATPSPAMAAKEA